MMLAGSGEARTFTGGDVLDMWADNAAIGGTRLEQLQHRLERS